MKLMIVIRDLRFGGAQRQVLALTKGLRERGHAVTVVVFYPDLYLAQDLRESGVELLSLDKRGRWDVPGSLFRLVSIIRKERPEIVHGYLDPANLLCSFAKPFFKGKAKLVW